MPREAFYGCSQSGHEVCAREEEAEGSMETVDLNPEEKRQKSQKKTVSAKGLNCVKC